jgi:shikimate kinase
VSGPVFLTGLMGSGKTTVGQLLARRLGWEWLDLDAALERRSGMKVAKIFETKGEAAFRRLESQELKRQARAGRTVISCGGGAVLAPENRRVLKGALTIYLAASPATLAKRLQGAQARPRPLLQGRGALQALQALQRERAHFYRACARFVLRAADPPSTVAGRAYQRVRSTLTP